MGSLHLSITQGSYSLTEVKDIDPLEIGSLLGSIGGFWGESRNPATQEGGRGCKTSITGLRRRRGGGVAGVLCADRSAVSTTALVALFDDVDAFGRLSQY